MKIIYGIFSPTSSITTGTPSSAAAGLPSCGSSPPSVSRLRRLPRRAKSRAVPPPLRCASSGMEAAGTAMYPLHRCKTIYLVRHAQGIHNVEGEKDPSAYMSPTLFDAQLTPLGWKQVDGLREHVKKCGLAKKVELVITSPLLRTMQTAVGVFGGDNYTHGASASPLMVENAGHSGRPAVSTFKSELPTISCS